MLLNIPEVILNNSRQRTHLWWNIHINTLLPFLMTNNNGWVVTVWHMFNANSVSEVRSGPTSVKWYLPFRFPIWNFVCTSRLCNASHLPWSDHLNNIWCLQTSLLWNFLQPPVIPLRSKYFQHFVLKHLQSMFFPWNEETKFHKHTKQHVKWYTVYKHTPEINSLIWVFC